MTQPILCLGETLVDLTCPTPVARFEDARAFVPWAAGAAANVAVGLALEGADVFLGGGVGDDAWGHWLEEQLDGAGVDLRFWSRAPGRETPVAFVTVDDGGSPSFLIYGRGIEEAIVASERSLEEALGAASALWIGSNTIVGAEERRVTYRAKELALALGRPVVVDANMRLARWGSVEAAIEETRRLAEGAFLLKLNDDEAELLTGETDPARAGDALLGLGCAQVVVTLGADGALLRGAVSGESPGVPAHAVDSTGAGDAVTAVLLAQLWRDGFRTDGLAGALPRAMEQAARCVEHLGALTYRLA
jgi:fructokinase